MPSSGGGIAGFEPTLTAPESPDNPSHDQRKTSNLGEPWGHLGVGQVLGGAAPSHASPIRPLTTGNTENEIKKAC